MTPPPVFQSRRTIVLSLGLGAGGTLILGVQPLLLGALLVAGKIDAVELGWIATAEVLGMALGVVIGVRALAGAGRHGRWFIVGASLLMALANLATPGADGMAMIALARAVAGLAAGAMLAVTILTITHAAAPGRLNAIFLTLGAIPQLALAYLLPTMIFPVHGFAAGFQMLAAIGVVLAVCAGLIRDRLAPGQTAVRGAIAWTPRVVVALAASLLTAAAIGACWTYVEPMGARSGLTPAAVGLAVTICLASQIAGSLFVALIGYRLPFRFVLPGGVLVQAAAIVLALAVPGAFAFSVALAIFGFCWQACLPFATDLVIEADASRQAAPLIMPLTLVGLSLGPLTASAVVGTSVAGAFAFGIAAFVAAAGLYLAMFGRDGIAARAASPDRTPTTAR